MMATYMGEDLVVGITCLDDQPNGKWVRNLGQGCAT